MIPEGMPELGLFKLIGDFVCAGLMFVIIIILLRCKRGGGPGAGLSG